MLYYLFRYLGEFGIPGAHIWGYISFRSILALILSLIISIWFGERFIKYMKRKHICETQRDPKIDPYGTAKIGVPTMGGIIIIVATILPCLLFGRLRNIYMIIMLVTTLWLSMLGFADDYIKMKKSKEGLRPLFKLIGQMILGLGIGLTLYLSPDAVIQENIVQQPPKSQSSQVENITLQAISDQDISSVSTDTEIAGNNIMLKNERVKSTKTTLPFIKSHNLDYAGWFGWLGDYQQTAGWVFFIIVTTFIIMAVSNGANLNDGMDGMCAGNSAIISIALGLLAYFSSHIEYARYFNIMYIPESQELVIFICAFVGALIGFLWYNAFPAQIFMGDTGSLPIGGIIGVTAICVHKELLIPVLCFIFFIESLSVMAQTSYARYGNKRGLKLRVFKRAPIHDTFRVLPSQIAPDTRILLNWPRGFWHESKITVRFWIVTIILAALAIITLKIR